MIKTLILDESYATRVIKLLEDRQLFSKQPNEGEVHEHLINSTKYCLEDGLKHRIIGCLENNKLKAIVCQTILYEHPVWYMNYYATDENKISLIHGYGPYLSSCFKKAMDDAEERGAYDFWFSVPESYAKNGPRMQKTSKEWLRYEVYTDIIIPANTYPKYDLHRQAYGRILKPHPVFIRHAVLKQEFRKVPLTK